MFCEERAGAQILITTCYSDFWEYYNFTTRDNTSLFVFFIPFLKDLSDNFTFSLRCNISK